MFIGFVSLFLLGKHVYKINVNLCGRNFSTFSVGSFSIKVILVKDVPNATTMITLEQGCQILLGTTYQNRKQ
jgi:hypothetical protein